MKCFFSVFLVLLLVCVPALAEAPALTYFWFSYGGYLPPQNYEVSFQDPFYQLKRDDGAACQLDMTVIERLLSIIEGYDLSTWDGFHENNPYVLDGEGFSLEIAFSDGTGIRAQGDNRFPAGYHGAAEEIVRLFDKALDGDFTGVYTYAGDGFGGDFTITLEEDGSYTFYEGFLSSYIGGGHWYAERREIYLAEENGFDLQFYFSAEDEDTLIYKGRYSDDFPYIKVPDGGKFVREHDEAGLTADEIVDFYYTCSTSTYPPFFQRYRFYKKNGRYYFYHETREGGDWPQTEEEITVSGTLALTEDEWTVFFSYLDGGTVKEPEAEIVDGDDGPWMYVYRGKGQEEYEFPSYQARLAFEAFCEEMSGK